LISTSSLLLSVARKNTDDNSLDPATFSRHAGPRVRAQYEAVVAGCGVLFAALFGQLVLIAGGVVVWLRISQPPPFRWDMVQTAVSMTVLDFLVSSCLLVSGLLAMMTVKRVLRRRYNLAAAMPCDSQSSDPGAA